MRDDYGKLYHDDVAAAVWYRIGGRDIHVTANYEERTVQITGPHKLKIVVSMDEYDEYPAPMLDYVTMKVRQFYDGGDQERLQL